MLEAPWGCMMKGEEGREHGCLGHHGVQDEKRGREGARMLGHTAEYTMKGRRGGRTDAERPCGVHVKRGGQGAQMLRGMMKGRRRRSTAARSCLQG